jgi:hypothetical protein
MQRTRRWQMVTRERGSSRRLASPGGRPGRRSRARRQQGIDDVTKVGDASGLTARAPEQRLGNWPRRQGIRHGSL